MQADAAPALPRIILVGPRGGANVGSVCRAMANMGAAELVTVDEDFDVAQARMMAVHAAGVLEGRVRAGSLAEAIAGCSAVIGTTARDGAYRERVADIRDVAYQLVGPGRPGRGPALVFGPEATGLTNEDIAVCHRLAFIPNASDGAHEPMSSLNLAQAVMVCLYEFMRARTAAGGSAGGPGIDQADAAEVDRMARDMEEALTEIGFLSEVSPLPVMAALRSVFGRASLDDREVRIMSGIARQIMWYARGGREVAADKRSRGRKLR